MSKTEKDHIDLYRETPVRYLGYANEVGESFRSLVHVNVVRFSYVVASGYVVADAVSKGIEASVRPCPSEEVRNTNIRRTVLDTLIWQGLATVAISGFTINRICAFYLFILRRVSNIPEPAKKWTTTAVGLGCIPFIIKPIDRSVDYFMEQTY
ncbi:hypothetical protein CHS0354_027145 [Potamilus streckersoni]|uniref:Mitochondrial fission process protein 1 n=1 Tax=Potamilus streckersoni TaxID=2493646 RepID=A0AAE0W3N9_9BIVA|nr:hypothetical protein CHS0354_027145 [Potamilus streckersoni]